MLSLQLAKGVTSNPPMPQLPQTTSRTPTTPPRSVSMSPSHRSCGRALSVCVCVSVGVSSCPPILSLLCRAPLSPASHAHCSLLWEARGTRFVFLRALASLFPSRTWMSHCLLLYQPAPWVLAVRGVGSHRSLSGPPFPLLLVARAGVPRAIGVPRASTPESSRKWRQHCV